MCLQKKTTTFTKSCSDRINEAEELMQSADKIVIGIGSGLSAAGGLCYTDTELAKKWYPEYFKIGRNSIIEIMSNFWPTMLKEENATFFWGFWAQHINHIRYRAAATQPYKDLMRIIGEKDYFIITSNADSQVEKANFHEDKIYAMQGNYCYFQCIQPCTDEVYYNEKMIDKMVSNMPNPFEIRAEDIPKCQHCGKLLVPNLHCDNTFVEKPHIKNANAYINFINDSKTKKIIFLELGVGYNTPGIIRYPFENMTNNMGNATLIRINNTCADVPKEIINKSISIQNDLAKTLRDMLSIKRGAL